MLLRLLTVGLLLVLAVAAGLAYDGRRRHEPRKIAPGLTPIGMLGDSDTAAYQDRTRVERGGPPGGAYHVITFQWPEVLARLRPEQVELGPWALWGVPRWLSMTRLRDGLGLRWRGPQRETYQHNLAWASGCEHLVEGGWRQAERLADVMDEQPEAWRRGVVVIRIGINNFGKAEDLAALARNADDPVVRAKIDRCVSQIRSAVALIHTRHPATRIVLVGIFDNSHWAPYVERWQSGGEQRRIRQGLDRYDDALRALAVADARLAFFDDRDWFERRWGGRDLETGRPTYRALQVGRLRVINAAGDSPEHAVLANLHAGLVWNLLWTQSLIELLRERFGLPIDALSDAEVVRWLDARLDEIGALPAR